MDNERRKARPERIRVRLLDDAAGATPLELPDRKMWRLGLIFAVIFAMFSSVEWVMLVRISAHPISDVFDLMLVLFEGFWVLGWSVGVVILGALSVLLLFYRESARLQNGRLIHVPRFGPLKVSVEYDLGRVRNVRVENAGGEGEARIKFDYGEGSTGLGDSMPRPEAEQLVEMIQRAAAAAGPMVETAPAPSASASANDAGQPGPAPAPHPRESPPPSPASPSGLALIGANLVPLVGVLFFGWDLASVMVLFWAESAVIGFYTVLKMAVVGKLAALFAAPFFVGHFGGFMAIHFLFIYGFFVRGFGATGPEPGVREALLGIFMPVWSSLAALFISHGVSFFTNFIGRREYAAAKMKDLTTAPYNRIVAMQFTLILGGWIVMVFKNPVPALALLVLLKTAVDLTAHRREHAQASATPSGSPVMSRPDLVLPTPCLTILPPKR